MCVAFNAIVQWTPNNKYQRITRYAVCVFCANGEKWFKCGCCRQRNQTTAISFAANSVLSVFYYSLSFSIIFFGLVANRDARAEIDGYIREPSVNLSFNSQLISYAKFEGNRELLYCLNWHRKCRKSFIEIGLAVQNHRWTATNYQMTWCLYMWP